MYYLPTRLVIAAAGNVNHHMLVKLVERYFKNLRMNGSVPQKRQSGPTAASKASRTEYARPINQAHICMGTVGYSIRHKNRYPLLILNALLGEGMSSRLYQSIREHHGLAYSVYSFVSMLSDTGVFGTYVGTEKKNVAAALELVHRELDRIKTRPISRAELDRTKSQIKGTMMLGLENMSGRMIRLGSSELYFESYISLDSILKRVDGVTPEAIMYTANDLFNEDDFTTVIIHPS
jgi:predicted Zn-dependent peptidase